MPHRLTGGLAVVLVVLISPTFALGSAPLPRKSVDVVFRKAEFQALHRFKNARLTCDWQAGVFTYNCLIWTPSKTAEGNYVQGENALVYSHRSVVACGKIATQADYPLTGCKTTTAEPSCRYAIFTYTTNDSAAARVLNVCRAGWQKQLQLLLLRG